jgi:hypothetical protein
MYCNVDGQSVAKQRLSKQISIRKLCFLCGTPRAKARRYRKSVARQRSGKHPQKWETVFSVGSVQRSYLKNKRRYSSVLSSEFSVEGGHGKFDL